MSVSPWHPTPVLLPGKSHGRRSLEGCSPQGRWGSNTTERLHFHFSLSCIGEGNGNPLQCSCLENPREGGACWAAVYGVAQSRTRLKRLSSSSSSHPRKLQTSTVQLYYWHWVVMFFSCLCDFMKDKVSLSLGILQTILQIKVKESKQAKKACYIS